MYGATLKGRAATLRADLVCGGGGVTGIGLAGAVSALADAGYVFPRVSGTSAGAIVAALVAAYQARGVPLSRLERDLRGLDYPRLVDAGPLHRLTGQLGLAESLIEHQGFYSTTYLHEWLHSKLDPIDVYTFGDLKITDDLQTGLAATQRYRLVVHAFDLTRQCSVRLPWDLPNYLFDPTTPATEQEHIAAIDAYPIVDAVRASMSIPLLFRPFRQATPHGPCTWVDGGLAQNLPTTVFDRADGTPGRWPTLGVTLAGRPDIAVPDTTVHGDIGELLAIAHTALGGWNRVALPDALGDTRTIRVDTMRVSATDFHIDTDTQLALYANGRCAANAFLDARHEAGLELQATERASTRRLRPVPEARSA